MLSLIPDVLVSSASIIYLGQYTGEERAVIQCLIKDAVDEEFESRSREISLFHKAPTEYSLVDCLGDPSEIRMWGMSGLPNDEELIQNALILIHC